MPPLCLLSCLPSLLWSGTISQSLCVFRDLDSLEARGPVERPHLDASEVVLVIRLGS